MSLNNKKSVLSLATIMAFRVLGLFMILPIFSAHAMTLPGATLTRIGLALGIYGLTQALLQIPFGLWSDRIGRKPIIALGLVLFALGSLVAALASNINTLILGRALQGTGAIGSATLALVADLTRDESRSKAMAFIGLSIGMAFSIAIIIGPIIFAWYQLSGIFWATAAFALVGLVLLTQVSKPPKLILHSSVELTPHRFITSFKNSQLLRLDFGIFSLHLILTALFIAIPILFTHVFNVSAWQQAGIYLVVLGLSFIIMLPFIIIAEKKRQMKQIFLAAITLLLITQILFFIFNHQKQIIGITLVLFFIAFNLLEASLPSLVSKLAPIQSKGTAMGLYSTSQYLGIAIGGTLGGTVFTHFGIDSIFILCGLSTLLWLLVASTMKPPPYLSTLIFEAHAQGTQLSQKLSHFAGVAEVTYSPEENLIYVKVDKKQTDESQLRKYIEEVTLTQVDRVEREERCNGKRN